MNMKTKMGKLLAGSVLGFLVMSLSLLLMPVKGIGFLPGCLFWAGLLTGVAGQIQLMPVKPRHTGKEKGTRCGLTTFFANPWAKSADIGLLVSLLTAMLTLAICPSAYICYVALAAAVFCFCLHCILNGRAFGCVMGHGRFRRKSEHNE